MTTEEWKLVKRRQVPQGFLKEHEDEIAVYSTRAKSLHPTKRALQMIGYPSHVLVMTSENNSNKLAIAPARPTNPDAYKITVKKGGAHSLYVPKKVQDMLTPLCRFETYIRDGMIIVNLSKATRL